MYFIKAETILNQIKESEEASWLFVDKKKEKKISNAFLTSKHTQSLALDSYMYVYQLLPEKLY